MRAACILLALWLLVAIATTSNAQGESEATGEKKTKKNA
jgi:hypothetical protein